MIDVHSHLLPGVDDGSRSIAQSVEVLTRFGTEGVDTLVCTPHLNASDAPRAPHARHAELLAELVAAAPMKPQLKLGWEIMLDVPGTDLTAPELALGGSTAVLVEFPRTTVPRGAAEELFRLRMSGIVPVLAHPERYWGCTTKHIREWRRVGAAIQMDAAALLGSGGQALLAQAMLEEGLADLIASDNHGDGRSLAGAKQWLIEIGAQDHARLLTHTNASRLLASMPTLDVPPLPTQRGMLGRLKELLIRRR